MEISGNTILITGGSSGIGFELARNFLDLNNEVIITGRDKTKLDQVKQSLPKIHVIQSDVSDPVAIKALYEKVSHHFPLLNILINNAGIMRKINFQVIENDLIKLTQEIEINLLGPIRMAKQFLPLLTVQKSAAIMNVSSAIAFVPYPISPIYSATKAGLHAFTQCLRLQLQMTPIKVFELAPPGTETHLFDQGFSKEDILDLKAMSVKALAQAAMDGFKKDKLEICPGLSKLLKLMSRLAPNFALKQLSKPLERMLRND